MIISEHAEEKMKKKNITKEEIERCLIDGETIFRKIIKGEIRYVKKIELKYKKLFVIYTIRNDEERIITCYTIRKKRV
jgi:uncharacterized DUF497 family protein